MHFTKISEWIVLRRFLICDGLLLTTYCEITMLAAAIQCMTWDHNHQFSVTYGEKHFMGKREKMWPCTLTGA